MSTKTNLAKVHLEIMKQSDESALINGRLSWRSPSIPPVPQARYDNPQSVCLDK